MPGAIVFVFQGGLARRLETHPSFEEAPSLAPGNGRFFISVDRPVAVGVSCLSPGATAMVTQVENQLALGGAKQFVLLNLAGGIGPDVTIGEVAVVETAVRDDAISDHYLPPGDTVDADAELTELLSHALRQHYPSMRHRISWTTPAIYRQTAEQLEHYIDAGVSLVESEIASLFAVTRATGATAAAVVVTTFRQHRDALETASNLELISATQHTARDVIIDTLSGSTGRDPSSA